MCVLCTFVAEVVDQDDLSYELWRRAVEHTVNRPQQRRPALVVEGDDDAGVGQLLGVELLFTAAQHGHTHRHQCFNLTNLAVRKQECKYLLSSVHVTTPQK